MDLLFHNQVILFAGVNRMLHDGYLEESWTNLLACTRLSTAWEPEAVDISHFVRFACVTFAYEATWQALQTNGWSDEQLARLQHEWESVDFFKDLPETAAFQRASAVDLCRRERREPRAKGLTLADYLKELSRSPLSAWRLVPDSWARWRYPSFGTYMDEKNLFLFYRDRELELRRAIQSPTWLAMRLLPGVTNYVLFRSRSPSRLQAILDMRAIAAATQRRGAPLLGRAAEAETRRRLILTAIALERFHARHGTYPNSLSALGPESKGVPMVDFMDGNPLRYRLTDEGHFVLYSVGLDCIDDAGRMRQPRGAGFPFVVEDAWGNLPAPDLVWPRPATAAEVESIRADTRSGHGAAPELPP